MQLYNFFKQLDMMLIIRFRTFQRHFRFLLIWYIRILPMKLPNCFWLCNTHFRIRLRLLRDLIKFRMKSRLRYLLNIIRKLRCQLQWRLRQLFKLKLQLMHCRSLRWRLCVLRFWRLRWMIYMIHQQLCMDMMIRLGYRWFWCMRKHNP